MENCEVGQEGNLYRKVCLQRPECHLAWQFLEDENTLESYPYEGIQAALAATQMQIESTLRKQGCRLQQSVLEQLQVRLHTLEELANEVS